MNLEVLRKLNSIRRKAAAKLMSGDNGAGVCYTKWEWVSEQRILSPCRTMDIGFQTDSNVFRPPNCSTARRQSGWDVHFNFTCKQQMVQG